MKWQEANYPEQIQNPDNMCLQRTSLCFRNIGAEANWYEETADIRDEVLPKNIKHNLEGYDKEKRHTKDNWEKRNNHRHHQETKANIIRVHM